MAHVDLQNANELSSEKNYSIYASTFTDTKSNEKNLRNRTTDFRAHPNVIIFENFHKTRAYPEVQINSTRKTLTDKKAIRRQKNVC